MPAADDLFRPTSPGETGEPASKAVRAVPDAPEPAESESESESSASQRKPSGRIRHDEKMTVYVTSDELLELEHARLSLRRTLGVGVDRGRLVREAIALVLADLEAEGEDSMLVRRLSEKP